MCVCVCVCVFVLFWIYMSELRGIFSSVRSKQNLWFNEYLPDVLVLLFLPCSYFPMKKWIKHKWITEAVIKASKFWHDNNRRLSLLVVSGPRAVHDGRGAAGRGGSPGAGPAGADAPEEGGTGDQQNPEGSAGEGEAVSDSSPQFVCGLYKLLVISAYH